MTIFGDKCTKVVRKSTKLISPYVNIKLISQ